MKRIYTEDGTRSAPFWFVATLTCLISPFMFVWCFVSTLAIEIAGAFRAAWLDVRMEWRVFVKIMRSGR